MNKKRSNYVYKLVGQVEKKEKISGKEQYEGTYFFRLLVDIENKPEIKVIRTFQKNLQNKLVWKEVQGDKFIGKKYLFFCKNWMGNYSLLD